MKIKIPRPEEYEFEIEDIYNTCIYFDWSADGIGFGQCSIKYDQEDEKFYADTEMMNREDLRKMLHAAVDKMADEAILDGTIEYKEMVKRKCK